MRTRSLFIALFMLGAGVVGCGGGDDDASSSADEPTTTASAESTTTAVSSEDELPGFMTEFDRVCTTQVGFGGAAAYDPTPGLHPVALFEDHGEPPTLIQSSRQLPAGWTVTEDSDYSDNTELAGVQLIGCANRTAATPTGINCDFDSDGKTVTLELVDTVYELAIYEARTGDLVGTPVELEGTSTDCPYFVSFEEGDTQYFTEPSDDQFIAALKPAVEI